MKKAIQMWKERDYFSVYTFLKENNYDYTIDNIEKDFGKINSMDKFCYLIYLLSNEYSVKNTLLVCDFLMYTDTFFYDIHPVIRLLIKHSLDLFPLESKLLNWIVANYENHPDSPFTRDEMDEYKVAIRNQSGDGSVIDKNLNK